MAGVEGHSVDVRAVDAEGCTANLVLMLGTSPEMRGGVAAVVAALREGGLFEKARVHYVATHVDQGTMAKLLRFSNALLTVSRLLYRGGIRVVHAHVSSRGSFWRKALLLWISRSFGRATIVHLHSGDFDKFAESDAVMGWRRLMVRRTLEKSNRVVVLTRSWAEWVHRFAPKAQTLIVGNPVIVPDVTERPADRAHIGGRVLYLGKICDAKGSFDLLRAWQVFRDKVPGWRLVIGGSGEVDRFLAAAQDLGVRGDIEFLGWVSGIDKARELARADIFVLPSYAEGMPVSILEAMAYGCAVITTPVGGVVDMMEPDHHGLWVQPGEVPSLARSLEQLARSPELRHRLGASAQKHVKAAYSVEAVIARLQCLYRDLQP